MFSFVINLLLFVKKSSLKKQMQFAKMQMEWLLIKNETHKSY